MTAMRPYSAFSIMGIWPRPLALGIGVTFILIQFAAAQEARPCLAEAIGTAQQSARVLAVRDARTLTLADGREIRLTGIEVPLADAPAEFARAALATMTAGRDVTLKRGPSAKNLPEGHAPQDRYDRMQVYLYVSGENQSLQERLLADGYARVAARLDDAECAPALLSRERAARKARAGLWRGEAFNPEKTSEADAIAAAAGQFAVLEGQIASVRESRGVVYINFGRRIGRDFSVTILKRNERSFIAAGLTPKNLEGKRVRVRGYIEQRRGPQIEATRPEQIELVELN